MSKIALFYGKKTAKAQSLENFMKESISLSGSSLANERVYLDNTRDKYDLLIIGISTFHKDEFQDDWEDFLENLNEVLTLLVDAETGQRGYIITGEEAYLEPYNKALLNLDLSTAKAPPAGTANLSAV